MRDGAGPSGTKVIGTKVIQPVDDVAAGDSQLLRRHHDDRRIRRITRRPRRNRPRTRMNPTLLPIPTAGHRRQLDGVVDSLICHRTGTDSESKGREPYSVRWARSAWYDVHSSANLREDFPRSDNLNGHRTICDSLPATNI